MSCMLRVLVRSAPQQPYAAPLPLLSRGGDRSFLKSGDLLMSPNTLGN